MDRPALMGISEPRPFPRWRLALALLLLLGSGIGLSLLLRIFTFQIPWMGGFLFLHWAIPGALSVLGSGWALRGWRIPDQCRSRTWWVGALTLVQALGLLAWVNWRHNMRELNHGAYSSHVEYVAMADRPADWLDPTHPQVYELGGGLRLALSPVIWTDGLHRSLPRTTPPDLEPYADTCEPRPLSGTGQRNLVALMKACALVRFFHPTDTAHFHDWAHLISQGVRRVEDAPTLEVLAHRLQQLLAPYAPTARLLLPGEPVPTLQIPDGAKLLARWHHVGIGSECIGQNHTGPIKDRSAHLAGVGMAWTTFQHFYPYWDVVDVDWEAVLPRALCEAAIAPTHEAYFDTIQRLCTQLKDSHAWPVDQSAVLPGWSSGKLEMVDGHPILAARWGQDMDFPLGSEILSVDGETAQQVIARRRELCPAATAAENEAQACSQLLMAPPNTTLHLEVAEPSGRRSSHEVLASRSSLHRDLPAPIREVKPGILLVDIARTSREAFNKALPRLVEAKGLILDHRGYPRYEDHLRHFRSGPLLGPQILTPVNLLPNGEGRTYQMTRYPIRSEGPFYRGRVVVLAGSPANVSHSETCLEVISANRLAPIVGRPTTGTNGNILVFVIPGNIDCIFTGLKVLKADGSRHHGIGILPTHPVKHTREALAAGRDEDVERALQLLETGS